MAVARSTSNATEKSVRKLEDRSSSGRSVNRDEELLGHRLLFSLLFLQSQGDVYFTESVVSCTERG